MPTTTTEQRERRRGMVAYLDALGFGPAQIARAVDVARPTVYKDLAAIESEWGDKLTAPQAAAQVRGVAHRLSSNLLDLVQAEDPTIRLQAVRTLWAIFRDRVAMEQLFGMMPKAPDQVEVGTDREMLDTIFQALMNRVSADAQLEIERALRSLDAEQPRLDKRLGPPGEDDSGGLAPGTGRRGRLDKRLGLGP